MKTRRAGITFCGSPKKTGNRKTYAASEAILRGKGKNRAEKKIGLPANFDKSTKLRKPPAFCFGRFSFIKKKKGKNRKGKDERKRQRLEGGRVCFLKAPAPFRRQNYFLRTREKFSRQRSEAKHLSFRNPPIPAVLFHGERISKTTKAEMPRGGRSESGSRLFVSFQP